MTYLSSVNDGLSITMRFSLFPKVFPLYHGFQSSYLQTTITNYSALSNKEMHREDIGTHKFS